jgi:hypothetical protein
MKLIYLNKKLDTSKEHEIFSNNEFGLKVTVTFKPGNFSNEILNNCTEVHYKYKDLGLHTTERIAFESDIHNTGCTYLIRNIKSVVIEEATEKEDEF